VGENPEHTRNVLSIALRGWQLACDGDLARRVGEVSESLRFDQVLL